MAAGDIPTRSLVKSMKETTGAINNEEILGFAFNPESRKKAETFGSRAERSESPGMHLTVGSGGGRQYPQGKENSTNKKAKPLPNVVIGKSVASHTLVQRRKSGRVSWWTK